MHDAEPLELRAGELKIMGLAWGPKDGLPTLALHGWLDNAASFSALAPLLCGCRVVAVDLPGHGLSEHRPAGSFYHFVDWIADVVAMADALDWPRFRLIGHSMGAGIASLVAGAFNERIERLLLIEGLGPLSSPPHEAPERVVRALQDFARLKKRRLRPYVSLEQASEQLRKVTFGLSEEGARCLLQRGMRQRSDGFVWRADPRLRGASLLRLDEAQVLAFLERISCPTLIMRATAGYPFDEEVMRTRARAIPSVKVVELFGGHHVHLDNAAQVAAVALPFLL